MNDETPEQKWKIQTAKLHELFPFLQDEDFHFDYGMKEVMMNKLQEKIGKSREQLNELLSNSLI